MESGRVPKKGRIRASAKKVESGRVPKKGRIQANTEKVEIRASVGKWKNPGGRVLERWNPGEW